MPNIYSKFVVSIFIFFYLATTRANSSSNQNEQLNCEPGEQRHFNYESSTKVWGSARQQVQLRATMRIRCMESPTNNTLKYMAEILSLTPAFGEPQDSRQNNNRETSGKQGKNLRRDGRSNNEQQLVAEPVFEEVGEQLVRVKRSVSSWFNKTWGSVKDFFVNIFTSEKTTISRDQAFQESGLDINHQCKSSGKSKNPFGNGIPLDESVFEDLQPEYYIGASTDPVVGFSYVFDGSDDPNKGGNGDDDDDEDSISFFDDPKAKTRRSRREISGSQTKGKKDSLNSYDKLLKLPFVFVQSKLGRIIEIRFSSEETDSSIKNFKRHLSDLFTTNLDRSKTQTNEMSPIGKHKTKYTIDSIDSARDHEQQQLVRALAIVVGATTTPTGGDDSNTTTTMVNGTHNGHLGDGGLSVVRSINSTSVIQLSSRAFSPDIEQMQVQVQQVQQFSDGRLVGSAGQLGMTLLQMSANGKSRPKRDVASGDGNGNGSGSNKDQNVEDIADLLQVTSSFAVHLVPASRLGSFLASNSQRVADLTSSSLTSSKLSDRRGGKRVKRATGSKPNGTEPLVAQPPRGEALERTMKELRQLERKLDFTTSSLVSESGGYQEGQLQRLELLKDQIQMRLNEESIRNRLKRMAMSASVLAGDSDQQRQQHPDLQRNSAASQQVAAATPSNDLGLGLTQLVLGNGITTKRKGPVYLTINEAIELEAKLDEAKEDASISRLLLDTIRMDKLKQHCKTSIASQEEIRGQSRLELRHPFNIDDLPSSMSESNKLLLASSGKFLAKNRRKLDQCQRILELMLRVGERRAADLVVELIDDCNERLLAGSKNEELGFGPTSRYYRELRQQFIELLAHMSKPSDSLLDKLMLRLSYLKSVDPLATSNAKRSRAREESEFVYVSTRDSNSNLDGKYNKSLLFQEDYYNNNDGAGSLVMTITTLASKSSIRSNKRGEIIDKLLHALKQTTCSLFNGPDLDILESMGNFRDLQEEVVGKVLHLTRKCRHQDTYLVACVHGLQGQLSSPLVQKFYFELVKSSNSSCLLKSEIVLSLIESITADELKAATSGTGEMTKTKQWPIVGMNKLDDLLLETTAAKNAASPDYRCLKQLVVHYMNLKHHQQPPDSEPATSRGMTRRSNGVGSRRRSRRAVVNENSFWDEASCKRWIVGEPSTGNSSLSASPSNALDSSGTLTDLVDEIDDNSIMSAITNFYLQQRNNSTSRTTKQQVSTHRARNMNLLESDSTGGNGTSSSQWSNNSTRKRHKCVASKSFGPKNAQATLKAEIVNDLVGSRDENKFLARFRLATNFLGNRIDVGRMYLWHQRQVTRAHANILGKSLWDTSHTCQDKAPGNFLYMPLFDFNLWLVKVSVGIRLQAEMGFFSNCQPIGPPESQGGGTSGAKSSSSGRWSYRSDKIMAQPDDVVVAPVGGQAPPTTIDELELYPTISLKASGEASAKFVVARAGMSLASQYGYQGNIRVSRQPDSCMSVSSAHQPMNVTFSSWFQLWDNDCHYWGSRNRAEPAATKWKITARKPNIWIADECLRNPNSSEKRSPQSISGGLGPPAT